MDRFVEFCLSTTLMCVRFKIVNKNVYCVIMIYCCEQAVTGHSIKFVIVLVGLKGIKGYRNNIGNE